MAMAMAIITKNLIIAKFCYALLMDEVTQKAIPGVKMYTLFLIPEPSQPYTSNNCLSFEILDTIPKVSLKFILTLKTHVLHYFKQNS